MKKFIISFVILLIFAGAAFIYGWLEFFVPVDKVGIMISKTGGVREEVIQAGTISWSWERLIPTNSKIRTFSVLPQIYTKNINGSLPSADIYKNMLEGNPNFDYSFSVEIGMSLSIDELSAFVKRTGAEDQNALDSFLDVQANSIARSVIEFVLTESMSDSDFVVQVSLTDDELIKGIQADTRYPELEIQSIIINDITLPDVTMYNYAKNSYAAYQNAVQEALNASFELQGFEAAQEYLELERLSRLGRVLAEYPQLIDFMAVSNGNLDITLPSSITGERSQ